MSSLLNKGGRPKKNGDEKRSHKVEVNLNKEEYGRLKYLCDIHSQSMAGAIRQAIYNDYIAFKKGY